MLVGISMPSSGGHFTDIEEEQGNEKYFFADNEDEYIFYDGHIKLENRKGKYDRIYKINIENSKLKNENNFKEAYKSFKFSIHSEIISPNQKYYHFVY